MSHRRQLLLLLLRWGPGGQREVLGDGVRGGDPVPRRGSCGEDGVGGGDWSLERLDLDGWGGRGGRGGKGGLPGLRVEERHIVLAGTDSSVGGLGTGSGEVRGCGQTGGL